VFVPGLYLRVIVYILELGGEEEAALSKSLVEDGSDSESGSSITSSIQRDEDFKGIGDDENDHDSVEDGDSFEDEAEQEDEEVYEIVEEGSDEE
jgi:hypothetical protein